MKTNKVNKLWVFLRLTAIVVLVLFLVAIRFGNPLSRAGDASLAIPAQETETRKPGTGKTGDKKAESKKAVTGKNENKKAESKKAGSTKTVTGKNESKKAESKKIDPIVALTILVLAIFVGFEVITKVPPTLHTPLMSGSNAISGITVVGAIIVAGNPYWGSSWLGMLAIALATVNVVGGFLVTHRMLAMFKKR